MDLIKCQLLSMVWNVKNDFDADLCNLDRNTVTESLDLDFKYLSIS